MDKTLRGKENDVDDERPRIAEAVYWVAKNGDRSGVQTLEILNVSDPARPA